MIQQTKIDKVKKVTERLENAKSIILIDYKGLNSEETHELRKRMNASNVDFFVEKNSLIKCYFKSINTNDLDKLLSGPTALAVSKGDEVSPAKVISNFIKEVTVDKEYPSIKGGYVNNALLSEVQVAQLAKLPPRDQMIAMFLSGLNAPIQNFVGIMSTLVKQVVTVVDAIAKKKEAEQN